MMRGIVRLSVLVSVFACTAGAAQSDVAFQIIGSPELFAPDIASTRYADIRLSISPDGKTAVWFSRDRPGGAGGYDIWLSRRVGKHWRPAQPVPFNTPARDFDPAFSSDGSYVYFSSDRAGGLGGSDLYRVAVLRDSFGQPEHLGVNVNSSGDEFAPMLSTDRRTLLFSSDRAGGSGGHDLFVAQTDGAGFAQARRIAGALNSEANEFDATFLADSQTIVFARALDLAKDRVDLFVARRGEDGYGAGERLSAPINDAANNTYGAMIDWSKPQRLLYSSRRNEARGMDLFSINYRLVR